MGSTVSAGDARHGRVGEDHGAVAGDQVAPVQPLAQEQRVLVREIIVGSVQLVEAPVVARERERCAADSSPAAVGRDPERRVGVAHQELAARQARSVARRAPPDAGGDVHGRDEGGDRSRGEARREHRGKYTAQRVIGFVGRRHAAARLLAPYSRPFMRRFSFALVLVTACSAAAEHADPKTAPSGQAAGTIPVETRVADT